MRALIAAGLTFAIAATVVLVAGYAAQTNAIIVIGQALAALALALLTIAAMAALLEPPEVHP